jgi:2-C-methyl-D-erythritol 4-phosphate cytidylyltransferase
LSGGKGGRFNSKTPKQYINLNGKLIIQYIIDTFINSHSFDKIIVVMDKKYKHLIKGNVIIINNGKTRQVSCYNALKYISNNFADCENVIISEGVRPCIKKETILECIAKLDTYNALITVCKSINTSCISKNKETLDVILDRTSQYDLLMPECFKFKKLYNAYEKINKDITSIVEIFKNAYPYDKIGIIPMSIWEGLKLTYPEDYEIIKTLLKKEK